MLAKLHMGGNLSAQRDRWGSLFGTDSVKLSETAGKVGLKNLGNTCFMNAGLQCLCHIEPFSGYFLTGKYKQEINRRNPRGTQGELANAFATLMQQLWQKKQPSHTPRSIHNALRICAPHLIEGYEQQDVQEFLAFCLDGLHEDLNLVVEQPPPQTEEQEKEDERLVEGRGEEFAAALAWMRYLQRGKSFLVDLFQGQLRSSLKCGRCGFERRRFDPFLYLSVPVLRNMNTISDAIEKFLEEEMLTGDERWNCPKCDCKVDACKQIQIWTLPPVLVLHLKRFEFDMRTFQFKKISTQLYSPPTVDLSSLVSSKQREGAVYEIVAVANHLGQFGSGHYTAYCQVGQPHERKWYHFNDDRVSLLGDGQFMGKEAYVLFLVRCSQDAMRRQTVSLPEVWPHWVSQRNSVLNDIVNPGSAAGRSRSEPRSSKLRDTYNRSRQSIQAMAQRFSLRRSHGKSGHDTSATLDVVREEELPARKSSVTHMVGAISLADTNEDWNCTVAGETLPRRSSSSNPILRRVSLTKSPLKENASQNGCEPTSTHASLTSPANSQIAAQETRQLTASEESPSEKTQRSGSPDKVARKASTSSASKSIPKKKAKARPKSVEKRGSRA